MFHPHEQIFILHNPLEITWINKRNPLILSINPLIESYAKGSLDKVIYKRRFPNVSRLTIARFNRGLRRIKCRREPFLHHVARSERGFKESGENLGVGRKVRKRAPSIEEVVRTRRKGRTLGKTGSGGDEGWRKGGPAADGGGRESFLGEKHVFVYFPSEGNSLCF